jgi:hypothetical protein
MASFAIFYLVGMYPLPATRQFLLASPYFPKVSFYNPVFNTTTTIIAKNFKGNPVDGKGGTVFVKVCCGSIVYFLTTSLMKVNCCRA